jgi:hypothetical protein
VNQVVDLLLCLPAIAAGYCWYRWMTTTDALERARAANLDMARELGRRDAELLVARAGQAADGCRRVIVLSTIDRPDPRDAVLPGAPFSRN